MVQQIQQQKEKLNRVIDKQKEGVWFNESEFLQVFKNNPKEAISYLKEASKLGTDYFCKCTHTRHNTYEERFELQQSTKHQTSLPS